MTTSKNLWVIPTDKPSRLSINCETDLLQLGLDNRMFHDDMHIYITSDEEIKEENLTKEIYVVDIQNGNIGKLTCKNRFFKGASKLIEIEWKNKQNIWNYNHIQKIILTTDQDLIKDGVQAIDDEFLEWFVKNPSCDFVKTEEYISYGVDNWKYLLTIPKEEPTMVDKLKEYFNNTTEEQIQKDWEEACRQTEGINSPTVDEFLEVQKQFSNQVSLEDFKVKPKEELKKEFVNNTSKWNIEDFEEPKQECIATKNMHLDAKMAYDSLSKQETLEEAKKQQFNYDNLHDAKELSSKIKEVESLEEAAERLYPNGCDGTDRSAEIYRRIFIEGAKWQQKRSYSEEEVKEIIKLSCQEGMLIQRTINDKVKIPYTRINDFTIKMFEKFKKK